LLFCKIFFGTMNATLAFVFLAEQCAAVFLGPVGKVNYKGFHLLAGSLTEGFGTAEIDGVRLDEVGIELMLADELAEAVADLGPTIVSVFPIDRLRREPLRLLRGGNWFGKRTDLLDGADADAVGLAECPVDRPGLGYPHLGAVDQGRHI
jgi:hypothetical protein